MGHRATERSRGGALGIDVDPLMILGVVGEAIDPGLVDQEPVRRADFPADGRLEFRQTVISVHTLLRHQGPDHVLTRLRRAGPGHGMAARPGGFPQAAIRRGGRSER